MTAMYIPYPDGTVATYVATPTSEGPWPGVEAPASLPQAREGWGGGGG